MLPTDEALFLRYRDQGDLESFGHLYDRYGGPIFGFLRRFVRDRSAAEDLAQQTFLRLHEARAAFDSTLSFRTWVFTIARRLAINWLDRERRTGGLAPGDKDAVDPGISPERLAIVRDEVRRVEEALASLSREDREVVLLAKYEGLTHVEVGRIVGCSGDAAKMRLHRALKRLSELLSAAARRSVG